MSRYTMIYMTAADRREATRIGKALVQERLAACVNVLGRVESLYWWKGRVQQGRETAFIAKTRSSLVQALVRRVCALHSYEAPCVVALPIGQGNPAFLKWLGEETKRPGQGGLRPQPRKRTTRRGTEN